MVSTIIDIKQTFDYVYLSHLFSYFIWKSVWT